MFKNLDRVIHENHMTINSVATALGMSESTLRYKMNNGNLSVHEAFQIHRTLFPRYDLFYLFKNEPIEKEDENSESITR